MNIQLLREIQERIRQEPLLFDIDAWVQFGQDLSPCGTTACIAGWAVALDGMRMHPKLTFDKVCQQADAIAHKYWDGLARPGRALLGLTPDQAYRLFYSHAWPEPFRERYDELADKLDQAETQACKARVRQAMSRLAVKRIDHFIATNGEE